jgi:arylformamidase
MKGESRLSRRQIGGSSLTRRTVLGVAAAVAAAPAFAEECRIGPTAHAQGPRVWLDLD